MYNLYNQLKNETISLSYFGVFSDKITSMLIDISENQVSKKENLKKLQNKTSFLIAESFQNLVRHGMNERENIADIQYNKDFFQISMLEDSIIISSANVLENKNVPELEETINYINALDSDELKTHYQNILTNGSFSEKGGAGLGLITMVRKSGLPLNKRFIPLDEGYSLLILSIEMTSRKGVKVSKLDINKKEILYKRFVEDGVLLLYKGDFSGSSNSNLIDMLNNNFLTDGQFRSDKVKNIVAIIEVLQNVSKHGNIINGSKEGIFSLSTVNKELYIECGNFIRKKDYAPLKNRLKKIKSSSMDDLDKLYKKTLALSYLSDDDNGGLGLLEISRFTENTFSYNFIETTDNEVFYTIKFKIV